jgi:cell division protein FtsX
MSDIKLVDITIHIDKDTDAATREKIEAALRGIDGVISVHMPANETHLVVIEYNPDATKSSVLLASVREIAGHAEMIGL